MHKHMKNLDIAKGICMICMILVHISGWTGYMRFMDKYTGVFFLVFFFFNAGLCYKETDWKPYILKRTKKLLAPYIFMTLIYFFYYECVIKNYIGYSIFDIIKKCFVSLIFASPSWIEDINFFHIDNISVGPVWFWNCLFVAYIFYYLISKIKYKLFITIILSIISAWSMKVCILPFNIQTAVIACMFMAIGDCLRVKILHFFEWLKKNTLYHNLLFTTAVGIIFIMAVNKLPYQWMNLGANQYFMISIISSVLGIILIMSMIEIIEKIHLGDNLLEYIGINSMFVLGIHHIDIMMFRDWGSFQLEPSQLTASCLLGYLFIVIIKDKFFVAAESRNTK